MSWNFRLVRDEDVVKYGSDENKQFNYICPRYWCLKNNTIVDPADLVEVKGKDGKSEILSLNLETLEYGPRVKAKFQSLELAPEATLTGKYWYYTICLELPKVSRRDSCVNT